MEQRNGGYLAAASVSAQFYPKAAQDPVQQEIAALREQLMITQKRLAAAQKSNRNWQKLAAQILSRILLTPVMNDFYKELAQTGIQNALESAPQVTRVSKMRCSFPSLGNSEKLQLKLEQWDSLQENQISINWKPAWEMEMGVEGQWNFIPFSVDVKVANLSIDGSLHASFTDEMEHVAVSFAKKPKIDLSIEIDVAVSTMPLPLPQAVHTMVPWCSRP